MPCNEIEYNPHYGVRANRLVSGGFYSYAWRGAFERRSAEKQCEGGPCAEAVSGPHLGIIIGEQLGSA